MATVSVDINIDYQFILFVLFAIGVCSTAPVYFYNRNKYFAGFISLILFILIFVFFGMRWFSGSEIVGPGAGYKGAWPPQIAVCPDYFTYYERGSGATAVKGCYNATKQMIGTITSNDTAPTNADAAYAFDHIYTSSANKGDLCKKAIEKGIAWEGLTDGDSCTF
jgi:hypothetical protein